MRNPEFFWWLQSWGQKNSRVCWVLSDWKNMGSWNFAGSFLHLFQEPGILFSIISQLVEVLFQFSREKSENHKFQKIFFHGLLIIIYIFEKGH
jgi:hypothetical protein